MLKTLQLSTTDTVKPEKKTRTKKTPDVADEFEGVDIPGFNLLSILKLKPATTILYKKPIEATKEEKNTIWTLGVQLVQEHGGTEAKARGFLARLIKEYGDKQVASAIAHISIKSLNPADIHSYLVGILKKQQAEEPVKRTGRGKVSI